MASLSLAGSLVQNDGLATIVKLPLISQKIVRDCLIVTTLNQSEQIITELPALQSVTVTTAPDVSAPLSTSVCPAKVITPKSSTLNYSSQMTATTFHQPFYTR